MQTKLVVFIITVFISAIFSSGHATSPIVIGLDADLTSGSARSGIAIRRGMILAVDKINTEGGVLGRKLALAIRDHHGNPARGIANMEAFNEMPHLVAVVGGLHTPVAMAELPLIHEYGIIYLSPWAAGTPVVSNGYNPNYVFRVSVRDEYAGPFLVRRALEIGHRRLGLLLEQTGWGHSNLKAMKQALEKQNLKPAGVGWFLWGTRDLSAQIAALKQAGAQAVMFVGNAPEGVTLVASMARLPEKDRIPIISHWGVAGGNFFDQVGNDLTGIDLRFLQTFSFLGPPFPGRAKAVITAYLAKWPDTGSVRGMFSPAGTAHAYDLIHILKSAIEKAGTIEPSKVRAALENLGPHSGLVRNYAPPFSPENHDALDSDDFSLARFASDGAIEPIPHGKTGTK